MPYWLKHNFQPGRNTVLISFDLKLFYDKSSLKSLYDHSVK